MMTVNQLLCRLAGDGVIRAFERNRVLELAI
jgi:hypothetical protein